MAISPFGQEPVKFHMPEIGPRAATRLGSLLDSGAISGDGPIGREVESGLSQLHNGSTVLLTSSCTHALEMAAVMLHRPERNRVLVPSYSFSSCAAAFDFHGWNVTFVDVRPGPLTIDPDSIERAITPDVGAIVYVNYGGFAPDLERVREFCNFRGIALVEDNAHGLGGQSEGTVLGTVGDVSTLSFHGTKNLTCGEGGALVLPKGSPYIDFAYLIREKGTNRHSFLEGKVNKYTWVSPGSSFVLSEIAAAVLAGNQESFDQVQHRRRAIFDYYRTLGPWARSRGFSIAPSAENDTTFAAHLFWLVAPNETSREKLEAHLHEYGIETATHYQALHDSPYAKKRGFPSSSCEVSSLTSRTLLRLPLYSRLSDTEVERVLRAVELFH